MDDKTKKILKDIINKANEKAEQYKRLKDRCNFLSLNLPLGATYEIEQLKTKKIGVWGRYKALEYCIMTICITYGIDKDDLRAEGLELLKID